MTRLQTIVAWTLAILVAIPLAAVALSAIGYTIELMTGTL